jgi:hypothetical protein
MAGPDLRVRMNDNREPPAVVRSDGPRSFDFSGPYQRQITGDPGGRPMVAVSRSTTGHGSSTSKGANWCVTPAVLQLTRRLRVN